MPRNTLTWKKIYGNLTAARHAPSKKVQITRYYVILMCAFLSVKNNYGKIRPRRAAVVCWPMKNLFSISIILSTTITLFWERTFEQSNNKLQENGKVEKSKKWSCTWSSSKSRKVEQFPFQPFTFWRFEILSDVFPVEHAHFFFFQLRAHPLIPDVSSMLLLCLKMKHPPF